MSPKTSYYSRTHEFLQNQEYAAQPPCTQQNQQVNPEISLHNPTFQHNSREVPSEHIIINDMPKPVLESQKKSTEIVNTSQDTVKDYIIKQEIKKSEPPEDIKTNHHTPSPPGKLRNFLLISYLVPQIPLAEENKGEEQKESFQRFPLQGSAYERRNIYKSFIRHIYCYTRKNREEIVEILLKAGYNMREVEHAFFVITSYQEHDKKEIKLKTSQSIIDSMIADKSIYTIILREALFAMMKNWEYRKIGKISKKNEKIYKDVCQKYYTEAVNLLHQPAQGKSFKLV